MGCCLFASILAGAPRLGFIVYWLIYPGRVQAAFSSFWIALLGVIFLPWLTLGYVFVAPGGINWFDWIVLGLALAVDISTYVGGGYGRSKR